MILIYPLKYIKSQDIIMSKDTDSTMVVRINEDSAALSLIVLHGKNKE